VARELRIVIRPADLAAIDLAVVEECLRNLDRPAHPGPRAAPRPDEAGARNPA
jgi:hypothetical protein